MTIINHLRHVSEAKKLNRMDSHALAVVWAPGLLREPSNLGIMEIGENTKYCIEAINTIIRIESKRHERIRKSCKIARDKSQRYSKKGLQEMSEFDSMSSLATIGTASEQDIVKRNLDFRRSDKNRKALQRRPVTYHEANSKETMI